MQEQTVSGVTPAVVVIAGGMGALGRALVASFKQRGDQVVVLDQAHGANGLPKVEADLALLKVDLNDTASTRQAFDTIMDRFGRLDVLVSVAGGFVYEEVAGGSVDAWDSMYSMNLRTAVVACQTVLPLLRARKAGRIVCIGADAVGKGRAGLGAYSSSKAGVMELVKTLATENRDHGITVNAVLPSTLDTPANRQAMPDADASRWVSMDAIASLILFLASPQASQISGACIPIVNRC
jgi:NAD(P)-dependent dehydrogenase (short-subunit alcohol dehydrogenase family)